MHNQTWKRFRKRGKAGRRLMYMQTIPLKERQLLTGNLSSLSLHVHSQQWRPLNSSLCLLPPRRRSEDSHRQQQHHSAEGWDSPACCYTNMLLGGSKDRTPGGLMANVQTPCNTDTELAQGSNGICFGHGGNSKSQVHTESENNLNNCCVVSVELSDIPTVQQVNKQRLRPVKRD